MCERLRLPEAATPRLVLASRPTTHPGRAQVVRRARELETTVANVNMEEKRAFMDGSKMVAIISEAASSGISLQALIVSITAIVNIEVTSSGISLQADRRPSE